MFSHQWWLAILSSIHSTILLHPFQELLCGLTAFEPIGNTESVFPMKGIVARQQPGTVTRWRFKHEFKSIEEKLVPSVTVRLEIGFVENRVWREQYGAAGQFSSFSKI